MKFGITERIKNVYERVNLSNLFVWGTRKIKHERLILILSFVIGMLSALAAIALKNCFYYANELILFSRHRTHENLLLIIFPIVGLLLTVLFIKYWVKDDISHGISKILYAISRQNSKIKSHNNYSSIIASTLTIAFGGSVGAEAPIALTGSSIGSNLGKFFHLDYKSLTLLIGCGAAGAISAIFKAPIAGVIFTLEVLMLDLTMSSVIPLLISSVTATILTYFLMGQSVLFSYTITEPFELRNIQYYVLLGLFAGLFSLYFTRMSNYIESKFSLVSNVYKKLLIGGIILSAFVFIFPPLYGEGYASLKNILSGHSENFVINSFFYYIKDNYWLLLAYLAVILFFKVMAMAVTNGAGGIGGVFAPSLFCGGFVGFIYARGINALPFIHVSEHNFALVGMAGVMAGVMQAPLTAIFLIAEMTNGYGLFIPLITTSAISFLTIRYFEKNSIYTKRLAIRGELITHDKDKAILSRINLDNLLETNFSILSPEMTLGELVKLVSVSHRNVFPVVDKYNNFIGVVSINDLRDKIFNPELYDKIFVKELMIIPPVIIDPEDSMGKVADRVSKSVEYNIPVIKDGKYLGFISKVNIFSAYRELLKSSSEE